MADAKSKKGSVIAKDGYCLVLRTADKDGRSYNGFQWPDKGTVSAPDWDPTPACGGGLHGLLWGDGDWSLLNSDADAKWYVVRVKADEIVRIDDRKVKFPKGEVLYAGGMAVALEMVLCDKWYIGELVKTADETSSGYSSKAASSGNYSTAASSGDYSTAASSGYYSTAASSGNSSTAASSGNSSTAASSGNYSTAASSGYSSTAASSGNSSTAASSGNYSTAASSGDYSKAVADGENTIAMAAGRNCMVSAGVNGCFASCWYDEKSKRNRIAIAYVGEDGIEAGVQYRLDENGKWQKGMVA